MHYSDYFDLSDTKSLRSRIDDIADQLCAAVSEDFNFTVKASVPDETMDKLAMLTNFVIENARRSVVNLQEKNEKLSELDQMKSAFLANISHELRTPLTLILAPLNSLLSNDYVELPERAREVVERMLRNAERLNTLVDDLLDLSKLEADKLKVSMAALDLGLFTRELVNELSPLAAERGIDLYDQISWQGHLAFVDAKMFEKIVLNLLSNALKFTPEGGKVWVKMNLNGTSIVLSVQDTGPGIPKDKQSLLFRRFQQIDSSSNRKFEGTGLGLALVKEFTELMGGRVHVTSAEGKGSTFFVELPFKPATNERAMELHSTNTKSKVILPQVTRTKASLENNGRPAVLIVEDNLDMSEYITEILSHDFQISAAPNGKEALAVMKSQVPDVIICDVMMPEMDGFEFLQRVKSNPEWRSIPTIMLTARAGREARIMGLEKGADDYLSKPFDSMELRSRVNSAIRARGLYKEVEKKNLELAAANKELEAFSYSVSHDLRAPLRSMDGFSKALLRHYDATLDGRGKDYLGRIRESAQHMAQLIDDILDLSRMSRTEMKTEVVDLSEIANSIARSFQTGSSRKVKFVIAPDIRAFGDRNLLRLAIENLFDNSWKFTSKHPSARIEFGVLERDGKKTYFIRDDGAGFDMTYADKLFGPFQRLHASSEFPGTGVGLALVKRVIHRHGGDIWAQAGIEKGATFYFTLGE